jgi:hypothetical protein
MPAARFVAWQQNGEHSGRLAVSDRALRCREVAKMSVVEGFGKQVWRINGYDGTRSIFERTIPQEELTVDQAQSLLRHLACRHLAEDEIVDAFRSKALHFEITPDTTGGKRLAWSIGSNSYYIVALFREDELPQPR